MTEDLRSDETKYWHNQIEKAIARERERCAKIADEYRQQLTNGGAINACKAIAAAIRQVTAVRPTTARRG